MGERRRDAAGNCVPTRVISSRRDPRVYPELRVRKQLHSYFYCCLFRFFPPPTHPNTFIYFNGSECKPDVEMVSFPLRVIWVSLMYTLNIYFSQLFSIALTVLMISS